MSHNYLCSFEVKVLKQNQINMDGESSEDQKTHLSSWDNSNWLLPNIFYSQICNYSAVNAITMIHFEWWILGKFFHRSFERVHTTINSIFLLNLHVFVETLLNLNLLQANKLQDLFQCRGVGQFLFYEISCTQRKRCTKT